MTQRQITGYFSFPNPFERKKVKMEETMGGGAAAVVGGNSEKALRLAKRNRYGKDTYKMRIPSHFRYCLRLLTYTTRQNLQNSQIPLTPTTDTPATIGYNVLPEGSPLLYHDLKPRSITGNNGQMSLNGSGLYWMWGEELPTPSCPWLTTYFAYKLDAAGFNICDPQQFSDNCQRFNFVKQGPSCATFVFPDKPIDKAGPVRRYYPLQAPTYTGAPGQPGTLSSYGVANVEERGIGAWEMIVIPPRKLHSIKIGSIVNQDGWDNLIDMGFKPRSVTRVVKIYCSNSGVDPLTLHTIINQSLEPEDRPRNTYQLSNLKYKKLSYLDTENVCQYTSVQATDLQAQQYNDISFYAAQGYPCIPFGSAVVFRFRQFAPPQMQVDTGGGISYTQTCIRQTIPMDVYLDSVTTFKSPVVGEFDLDQPFTDPQYQPPKPPPE